MFLYPNCLQVLQMCNYPLIAARHGVNSLHVLLFGMAFSDASLLFSSLFLFPPVHYCIKAPVRVSFFLNNCTKRRKRPKTGRVHVHNPQRCVSSYNVHVSANGSVVHCVCLCRYRTRPLHCCHVPTTRVVTIDATVTKAL